MFVCFMFFHCLPGEVLASVIDASEVDVETAAKAAKAAFETWSKLSNNARARHLYRWFENKKCYL